MLNPIYIINQVFELQAKIKDCGLATQFERSFSRLLNLFEEEGYLVQDPTGETYTDARTDCESSISGRLGSREISLTATVTQFELGRFLEWRFQDSYGVKGTQFWEINAMDDTTVVRMRDQYEMPGTFGRAFDWLFTRHAVARRDRDWLAHLRRLAERR